MSDGQLAVIGVGSVGSMALWQASKLGVDPVGFEAVSPAHPRSAVGGDSRLFRMTYRGEHNFYPVLQLAERLWRRLEEESGQQILNQCGGLSIGETDGSYIPALLDSIRRTGARHEILDYAEMTRRYPQHRLSPDECGIFDPAAGFLRTDRAVLSAVELAQAHGAQVVKGARVREIREVSDGVRISTDTDSWTFDRVIVASGFGSGAVLPPFLQRHVHPKRLLLTWFTARDTKQFVPEAFPIFIRITGDRSLYGTPTVDGVTVKATLDGRGTMTPDARHHRSRAHGRRGRRVGRHGPGVPAGSGPRDRPRRMRTPTSGRPTRPACWARCRAATESTARPASPAPVSRCRRPSGPSPPPRRWAGIRSWKAWTSFVRRASALPTESRRSRLNGIAASHPRAFRISTTRRALLSMWCRTWCTAAALSPDSMAWRITWCWASMSSGRSNSRSSSDSTVR